MSLEEKLVQVLKDEKLFALVGDEDAITELTTRAIREALFTPIVEKDRWGSINRQADAPVVAAARDIAQKAVSKVVADMIETITADPVLRTIINHACPVNAHSG
jgi:hypothetical protein